MEIYRDSMFSKRGTGLQACMCTVIELNSSMTECAKKSRLLPEGLFRWKAAVYRQQKTCCEPHHTFTSSYIVWELSSTHLPTVLLDTSTQHVPTCLVTRQVVEMCTVTQKLDMLVFDKCKMWTSL